MKSLEFMWNGGNTRRFHTMHTLKDDTVGHHSFNVACIIIHLRPDAPARLLRAAIKHDAAEHIVGDMPAPTKRGLPAYASRPIAGDGPASFREVFGDYEYRRAKEHGVYIDEALEPQESWLLKLADSMDGMRFCIQERRMGNRHPKLVEAYENFRGYVHALMHSSPEGRERTQPQDIKLCNHLEVEWHNAGR